MGGVVFNFKKVRSFITMDKLHTCFHSKIHNFNGFSSCFVVWLLATILVSSVLVKGVSDLTDNMEDVLDLVDDSLSPVEVSTNSRNEVPSK